MSTPVTIVHYWAGCPVVASSKWERFVHLVRACADRGWSTHLALSSVPEDPALHEPFRACGCTLSVLPRARRSFDGRAIAATYRYVRKVGCDILHCHNVHTSPLVAAALARVRVRLWSKLSMTAQYEQGGRATRAFLPSLRVSAMLAHRILPLSQAIADELVSIGVRPGKIEVLAAPIDLEKYRRASANGLRRELNISAETPLIVTVGHAVPVKGWDILVEAFARARERIPEAHLLLVGGTDAPQELAFARQLRERVARHGLGGRVHFAGMRRDVPAILKSSDVFAFPSRSDGQGLALTEAIACGLPCVASAAGGIPEIIEDGRNGLLFPREDVDKCADLLVEVVRSKPLAARLGQEAGRSAERFSLQAYTQRVLGIYEELL